MSEKDLKREILDLKAELRRLKKNYLGLVFEDKPEDIVIQCQQNIPVLKEVKAKRIVKDVERPNNLLIEGDNYHALCVLNYTHKKNIDLIYIDPPYNTGAKNWKYNNDYVDKEDEYRHSKWLSLMRHRLNLARELLKDDGVLICAIDENEQAHLGVLIESIFPAHEQHTITIVHNPKGVQGNNFSYSHEYAIFVVPKDKTIIGARSLTEEEMYISNLRNWGNESERTDAKNCFYPIIISDGKIIGFGDVAPNNFHPKSANEKKKDKSIYVWPIDEKGVERKWRYARQSVDEIKDILQIKESRNGLIQIMIAKDYGTYKTVWSDKKYDASEYGTKLLREIIPGCDFDFPKSLYTVYDCLFAVIGNRPRANVLDFFAGSGTTGHAVLEMNKADGGERKFILCTNNENNNGNGTGGIAESVCYPRIKKVIEGYKDKKNEKVAGLGGNLFYYKTDLVNIDKIQKIPDEAKIRVTYQAGEMIAVREDTLNEVEKNEWWQIFEGKEKITSIYFKEDKSKLMELVEKLEKKKISVALYIFSWGKNEYKGEYSSANIRVEDIPEPILEVYKEINRL
jgi:adenine-specific DNA-methyltransferase